MKMPDLSTTDSAIRLVGWLVQPGQSIKRGQALCEIETDKATSQVESIVTGVLKELRAKPGDMLSVGQDMALFETEASPVMSPSAAPARARGPGLFARNRTAAVAAGPAAPASTPSISLSQTQQMVGRRLQASKQNIPHFYLQASANAEPMMRRRQAASPKPVWEAFVLLAVSKALADFERIRWRVDGQRVVVAANSDIGVAIDVRGDLFVAPIAISPGASVEDISNAIRRQAGEIERDPQNACALRPAAITVTNLGDSCVESFAAIINPPEVAILAIGKIGPVPVAQEGRVAVQHRMALTLSADHRVINGKHAADFLGAIVREIESF